MAGWLIGWLSSPIECKEAFVEYPGALAVTAHRDAAASPRLALPFVIIQISDVSLPCKGIVVADGPKRESDLSRQ